jgi:hypothetical protein
MLRSCTKIIHTYFKTLSGCSTEGTELNHVNRQNKSTMTKFQEKCCLNMQQK